MRILVATGGAPHSDIAVLMGGLIHQVTGGQLTLLTVNRQTDEKDQSEAILLRAQLLVAAVGAVETVIRTGQTAEEIVRTAADGSFDVIVVGERSRHGLARRLLYPTAERVIAKMPCPVLIARGLPRPLRRVLICEGGRNPSLLTRLIARLSDLLEHVEDLAILHVMSQIAAAPGVPGWELRAEAQELIERHTTEGAFLREDLAHLARLNVRLEAKVRHGLIVQEILAEAQDGDYDLVVIGTHDREGWGRLLLDDLAHEIINQVDRPLLVV